jgi:hypothetical protein
VFLLCKMELPPWDPMWPYKRLTWRELRMRPRDQRWSDTPNFMACREG